VSAAAGEVLLAASGLTKRYARRSWLGLRRSATGGAALAGVNLEMRRGECLAVVGESGSGKTTLALCLLRLIEPSAGSVRFDGEDLLALSPRALRRRRRLIQMIYQDPQDALDPRQRIGAAVAEPLLLHRLVPAAPGVPSVRRRARDRAVELLATVGLPAEAADRFPHQLSGGQRQRVGIARALAVGPRLLIADEPVSALDVSVRSQILNLLAGLQQRLGLTLLLIAHDLAAVEQMADRVAVLYRGRVVEQAPVAELFARPRHPYTASLLAAVPRPWPGAGRRRTGRPQAPVDGASGAAPGAVAAVLPATEPGAAASAAEACPYLPLCPVAGDRCRGERPLLLPLAGAGAAAGEPDGHLVACFHPGRVPPPEVAISPLEGREAP
jgi:oligopeptide/dipeptide ABC transporter ATP-binding protein